MSVLSALRSEVFDAQGWRCLWPGCDESLRHLGELAHIRHRGMGGNPDGSRNVESNLAGMCQTHHVMFDEGPLVLADLSDLLDATLDGGRQVQCRWPQCFAVPVGGSVRQLCDLHSDVVDVSRVVPYRRSQISVLIRVLVDRRDRPVAGVEIVEGIL